MGLFIRQTLNGGIFMDTKMKVYHGSQFLFEEFNGDFIGKNANSEGKGFYFTDDKRIAEGYAGKDGFVYEVLFNGKKPLSSDTITITKSQLRTFLRAIHEEYDYLNDWGDVESDGIERVLSVAVEGELNGSDSDVDVIAGICNLVGDNGGVLDVLYHTLGFDSIIVTAAWGRQDFEQTLYIALVTDIIEIVNIERKELIAS